MQDVRCPWILARDNASSSNAARIAMMAMTTSNSIKVNPFFIWQADFNRYWPGFPILDFIFAPSNFLMQPEESRALWRELNAVETLDVGGGLRIGEIERAAAEQIGLQRNPSLQVCAGLNDHVGAGRADHIETKHPVGDAKRRAGGDEKGCGNCGNNNLAIV